jgi:hypothetical protein
MYCSPRSGESATLSVTDECQGWNGDIGQCRKLNPVPHKGSPTQARR